MHNSSACIVRDGELLFAVAEERLSRIKHDAGFPRLAVQACLDFAGVPASQLDEVCFGWPRPGAAFRHDLRCFATGKMPANYLNVLNSTLHFLSMWHQQGGAKRFTQHFGKVKARMRFVDHHLAHGNWRARCGAIAASRESCFTLSSADLLMPTPVGRATIAIAFEKMIELRSPDTRQAKLGESALRISL